MDFLSAVKTCFRKYFGFNGRATRSEFWFWMLFVLGMGLFLKLLDHFIFGTPVTGRAIRPVNDIFSWVILFPLLAVAWRRLHDTGRSGWWIGSGLVWITFWLIFSFILIRVVFGAVETGVINDTNSDNFAWLSNCLKAAPILIVGVLWVWMAGLLIVFCLDTEKGENKYGEDSKYERGATVFD